MTGIFRTAILFTACCAMSEFGYAQSVARSTDTSKNIQHTFAPLKTKGPKPISHELSAGIRANTNGGSGFIDIGRIKSKDIKHSDMFYNIRFWQIELTEKQSPKEKKSTSQNGNKYKYGKINNFFALKLGRGYTKMIAGKPDPGSVSIHWIYAGGLSVGMLKPYYLNVYSDPNAIKYDEGHKDDFLNQYMIEGNTGPFKGLNEIKFIPGFHLKSALHFDFSANRKSVLGVEAGVNFEYYSQQIQLMANQPATAYFADMYVSLQFGKRW